MKILKILQPHLIALGVFALVSYLYVKPSFDEKTTKSSDAVQYEAMTHGNQLARQKEGVIPKWNRNMFSGMPFYFAHLENDPLAGKILNIINYAFNLQFLYAFNNTYFAYFFVACVCFYFLTQVLKISYLIGILGGLAFAFSSNIPILIIAGHHTKIMSIAFMPYVLGCLLLAFQKKYWWGLLLGSLSVGALFGYGHYQIVFYTLIMIFFVSVTYLIHYIKTHKYNISYKHLGIVSGITLLMLGIGVMKNAGAFLATKDYADVSTRSGSAIVNTQLHNSALKQQKNKDKGVGKDYAFTWSYMPSETFSFLAPHIYGGASGRMLSENSKVFETAKKYGVNDTEALQIAQSIDTYWGEQPFTEGPIYYGIIICFLFLFGLFYYRSWYLWWIISLSICAIFIAWGKYFSFFNYFLYEYLPYYNKFRAPSMILCIPQCTFPLLACLTLQKILATKCDIQTLLPYLKKTLYIFSGIFITLVLFYFTASFSDPQKDSQIKNWLGQISGNNNEFIHMFMKAILSDRKDMLSKDLIKILFISGIFLGLLWTYLRTKLNKFLLIILTSILILGDLLLTDIKYLHYDSFSAEAIDSNNPSNPSDLFPLRQVDKYILKDKDPNFRVLDLTAPNLFANAKPSYYHRNIGGYYAAKLAIYQDLIDSQLSKLNPRVLTMLNTKYIILKDEKGEDGIQILQPLGAAWFVKNIDYVPDTYQAMLRLNDFNPHETAIIEERFKKYIGNDIFPKSTEHNNKTEKITNILAKNDTMIYQSHNSQNELAVFSEIYCDKGWRAYINEKEVPIIKANYVLRALSIPPGHNTIKFIFHPTIFNTTKKIQLVTAFALIIIIIGTFYFERKNILSLFQINKK